MKRTILVSAFGLVFGCSANDRGERHEQKAVEERHEAQKDLMKGREEANKDLAKAREEANTDLDKAHDQELKASEARSKAAIDQRREPVVGRDDTMLVRDSLRDKLGDDWMLEQTAAGWTAVRKTIKKADKDLPKKIADEQKNLRDDHKDATARYAHGEVVLRGSLDDCNDVGKTADKFAKIDGVNKIAVDMSCARK